MRIKLLVAVVSAFLCAVLLIPTVTMGQGKKGGFGGGGPGGFGGGAPGGFGGGPGGFGKGNFGGGNSDPNQMFDFLARGRNFFLVTDTQRLRQPLTEYLESKGISNGQVTREIFTAFNEQMKGMGMSMGG